MGCSSSRPDAQFEDADEVEAFDIDPSAAPRPIEGIVDFISPSTKKFAKHFISVEDGEFLYRLAKKSEMLCLAVNQFLSVERDPDTAVEFTFRVPMVNAEKPLAFRLASRAQCKRWANVIEHHIMHSRGETGAASSGGAPSALPAYREVNADADEAAAEAEAEGHDELAPVPLVSFAGHADSTAAASGAATTTNGEIDGVVSSMHSAEAGGGGNSSSRDSQGGAGNVDLARTESMSHAAKMQLLKANMMAMQRLSDRSNNASMRSSTATEIDAPAAAPVVAATEVDAPAAAPEMDGDTDTESESEAEAEAAHEAAAPAPSPAPPPEAPPAAAPAVTNLPLSTTRRGDSLTESFSRSPRRQPMMPMAALSPRGPATAIPDAADILGNAAAARRLSTDMDLEQRRQARLSQLSWLLKEEKGISDDEDESTRCSSRSSSNLSRTHSKPGRSTTMSPQRGAASMLKRSATTGVRISGGRSPRSPNGSRSSRSSRNGGGDPAYVPSRGRLPTDPGPPPRRPGEPIVASTMPQPPPPTRAPPPQREADWEVESRLLMAAAQRQECALARNRDDDGTTPRPAVPPPSYPTLHSCRVSNRSMVRFTFSVLGPAASAASVTAGGTPKLVKVRMAAAEETPVAALAKWYYIDVGGAVMGPLGNRRMAELTRCGIIGPTTWVWADHLHGWDTLKHLNALLEHPPSVAAREDLEQWKRDEATEAAAAAAAAASAKDLASSLPRSSRAPDTSLANVDWYYVDDAGTTIGPVSTAHMSELTESGTLGPTSYIWAEHLGNWIMLERMPLSGASAQASVGGPASANAFASAPASTPALSALSRHSNRRNSMPARLLPPPPPANSASPSAAKAAAAAAASTAAGAANAVAAAVDAQIEAESRVAAAEAAAAAAAESAKREAERAAAAEAAIAAAEARVVQERAAAEEARVQAEREEAARAREEAAAARALTDEATAALSELMAAQQSAAATAQAALAEKAAMEAKLKQIEQQQQQQSDAAAPMPRRSSRSSNAISRSASSCTSEAVSSRTTMNGVGAARRRDSDAADALAPAQLPAPQRMNPLVPSSLTHEYRCDRCQAKVRIDAAPTTRLREVTTNCKSCGLDLMLILYPDGSTRRAGQEDTDSSDDEAVSPTPEQKKVIAAARASITAARRSGADSGGANISLKPPRLSGASYGDGMVYIPPPSTARDVPSAPQLGGAATGKAGTSRDSGRLSARNSSRISHRQTITSMPIIDHPSMPAPPPELMQPRLTHPSARPPSVASPLSAGATSDGTRYSTSSSASASSSNVRWSVHEGERASRTSLSQAPPAFPPMVNAAEAPGSAPPRQPNGAQTQPAAIVGMAAVENVMRQRSATARGSRIEATRAEFTLGRPSAASTSLDNAAADSVLRHGFQGANVRAPDAEANIGAHGVKFATSGFTAALPGTRMSKASLQQRARGQSFSSAI